MPERASVHFSAFKEGLPRVEGKVFVITGTTSGTGFIAARTVLEKGGEVVCLNRPSQRVAESTARLLATAPEVAGSAKVVNIECDLQDFASVRSAAAAVKAQYQHIYALVCNAGLSHLKDELTKDECCKTMQTNHTSHFLLVSELYPLLEKGAALHGDARVVFHTSEARNLAEKKRLEERYLLKNGGNLGGDGKSVLFGGGRIYRYAQSKLANSVMTHAMHHKLQVKSSKVKVCCAHPGFALTGTKGIISLPPLERLLFDCFLIPFMMQSGEDGTMGLLTGMMSEDAVSGTLYGPVGKNNMAGPVKMIPPNQWENDPEAMELLWRASEEVTGVTFVI